MFIFTNCSNPKIVQIRKIVQNKKLLLFENCSNLEIVQIRKIVQNKKSFIFKNCSNSKIVQIRKLFRFKFCLDFKNIKKIVQIKKRSDLKKYWFLYKNSDFRNVQINKFDFFSNSKSIQILKNIQIWNLLEFKNIFLKHKKGKSTLLFYWPLPANPRSD